MSSPSQPSGFQKILEEHRALRKLLAQIEQELTKKSSPVTEVGDLLGQLGDRLVRHFAFEEEEGYFSDAVSRSPQLVAKANDLMAQHPKMCARVRDLTIQIGPSPSAPDWWEETRTRFLAFKEELLKHERTEDALIQEAYNRDIGSHD